MDAQKKLEFVHRQTKLALEHVQHYDKGGPVVSTSNGQPSNPNNPSVTALGGPSTGSVNQNATNPNTGLLGTVNGLLGLNDNFKAGSANIQAGTNQAQLNQSYQGVQSGLTQQQNLTNQLQPGVAQGLNAESNLSQQLANEAAGRGPNPALAALNQSTGQNIQQQAALMAGQRGAGANAGLLATEAARQGAETQQQAIGQAATLQAQQQLAAQQEEQNLASTQIGQGATAIQNVNQQQQNEQNILQGANTSANNAAVGMQSNINNVNAQTAAANQNMAGNLFGGILSGASSAISSIGSLFAEGGLVKMDRGGNVLDANARKHISKENFALPGRRYPIHDISHARNALARVSQYGTSVEKAKVRAAVHKKYPSLAGPKMMADGGDVDSGDDTPSFQPTSSDVSNGPNVPSTATLPADQTNFASAMNSGSSGKSSGGGGGGSALGLLALMAKGGEVRHGYMKLAQGSYLAPTPLVVGQNGPQSFAAQWVNSNVTPTSGPSVQATPSLSLGNSMNGNLSKAVQSALGNNKKPQDDSDRDTEQEYLDADAAIGPTTQEQLPADNNDLGPMQYTLGDNDVRTAARGGLMKQGGQVKAQNSKQKASVEGDSLKNDKVPAMLSEGELVIDRDTMKDPGPMGQMARALAQHIEKRNKSKGK